MAGYRQHRRPRVGKRRARYLTRASAAKLRYGQTRLLDPGLDSTGDSVALARLTWRSIASCVAVTLSHYVNDITPSESVRCSPRVVGVGVRRHFIRIVRRVFAAFGQCDCRITSLAVKQV